MYQFLFFFYGVVGFAALFQLIDKIFGFNSTPDQQITAQWHHTALHFVGGNCDLLRVIITIENTIKKPLEQKNNHPSKLLESTLAYCFDIIDHSTDLPTKKV